MYFRYSRVAVLEAEFTFVVLGILLGEHDAVNNVLQPVGRGTCPKGAYCSLLGDLGFDGLEFCLGGFVLQDFLRVLALVDVNLFFIQVLGKNEDSGVCVLRDLMRVTGTGKDLNLVGFLVRDRGRREF